MYSLTAMHQMNNPELYKLRDEEKEWIKQDPMYPAQLALMDYKGSLLSDWDRVRAAKAYAYMRRLRWDEYGVATEV